MATLNRRTLLQTTVAAFAVSTYTAAFSREKKVPTKVLLRSSWQTVNIGDIAHTPGMLALLEKHRPDAEVTLWPSSVDRGVEEILRARFPKLTIAKSKAEQQTALADWDFFLHGSGPSLVGLKELIRARDAGYWVTAEACSVYSQAAAIVSMEQHSPIMGIAAGVPSVLVRQPTDTRKGRMWYDLKMSDWVFEIDTTTGTQIADRLVQIGNDLPAAREKAATARSLAHELMASMIAAIP